MSSVVVTQTEPSSLGGLTTVHIQALSAGHLTLPENQFVSPASTTARKTVPSFSFLIQHVNPHTKKKTRLLFDLGLRRNTKKYSDPIQRHITTRQPLITTPDVVESLATGGLAPSDIDYVIYSHVHWDHVGEPLDFPRSEFVVGNGALALLRGQNSSLKGGHSFFEADLLDPKRTVELSRPPGEVNVPERAKPRPAKGEISFHQPWTSFGTLPHVLDLFQDQSVYIVHAPGHLPGHINILARTSLTNWVYLAGDACHDRRILRKEKEIGEWLDDRGHVCCIHANRKDAEKTIEHIRKLEQSGVEIIFAHDVEWEEDPANKARIWGL